MDTEFTLEERTFASGNIIKTAKESYVEGFESGFLWPDAWEDHGKPGGPWVYSGQSNDPANITWHKASKAANQAWCKGWEDGHKSKLLAKKHGGNLEAWKRLARQN